MIIYLSECSGRFDNTTATEKKVTNEREIESAILACLVKCCPLSVLNGNIRNHKEKKAGYTLASCN